MHKEAHDIKLDRIIQHSCLSSMMNESDESYGSLMTEAERASYKAKERLALHVLQEVATMLHSMHESGYVHGDIKGDNIMICHHDGASKGANKDTTASSPAGYYTISLIDLGHTVKMGKTSCGTYEVRVKFSTADVTYPPSRFKSYSKHFRPLTLCPPMLHNSTRLPLT